MDLTEDRTRVSLAFGLTVFDLATALRLIRESNPEDSPALPVRVLPSLEGPPMAADLLVPLACDLPPPLPCVSPP